MTIVEVDDTAEGAAAGRFVISRSGHDFSRDMIVYFRLIESAGLVYGVDYTTSPATSAGAPMPDGSTTRTGLVIIPMGQSTKVVTVSPIDDGAVEEHETLTMVLIDPPSGQPAENDTYMRYAIGDSATSVAPANPMNLCDNDVDLDLDFDGVSEGEEQDPGAFVGVNQNYDEQNSGVFSESPPGAGTVSVVGSLADNEPDRALGDRIVPGDGDLLSATLHVDRPSDCEVEGTLTWTIPSVIKAWWEEDGHWVRVHTVEHFPAPSQRDILIEGITSGSGQIQVAFEPTQPGSGAQSNKQTSGTVTTFEVDLQIFMPKVIDAGESMIAPREEETVGSVTFVNQDDDDNDGVFDRRVNNMQSQPLDDNNVVGGDNELVKLRLYVPAGVPGNVTLLASCGGENVQLWEQNTKAQPYQLGTAIAVSGQAGGGWSAEGSRLYRELWVEGISAHIVQQGTMLVESFTPTGAGAPVSDQAALTVVGIEKVEWLGKRNSKTDDANLDEDPTSVWLTIFEQRPHRVFPDARLRDGKPEASPRNAVEAQVTLTVAPPRAIDIHVKRFDVDDPTSEKDPFDDPTLVAIPVDEDRVGKPSAKQDDNNERLPDSESFQLHFAASNSVRVGKHDVRISKQPGDNFRLAANGDASFIASLENKDLRQHVGASDAERNANKQRITIPDPATGTPQEREVALESVSDVLVVWRFLHVEHDSFGLPAPSDVFGGTGVGQDDVYPGDIGHPNNPDPLFRQPPTDLLKTEFARAFIEVVEDLGAVDVKDDAEFVHNDDRFQGGLSVHNSAVSKRDVNGNAGFWAVQIFAAYEGTQSSDNDLTVEEGPDDNNRDIFAETIDDKKVLNDGSTLDVFSEVVIYLETIRDRNPDPALSAPAGTPPNILEVPEKLAKRIVVHEVFHWLSGITHNYFREAKWFRNDDLGNTGVLDSHLTNEKDRDSEFHMTDYQLAWVRSVRTPGVLFPDEPVPPAD